MNSFTSGINSHQINTIKQQILTWLQPFNICCFLDNNQYSSNYHQVECLVAVNATHSICPSAHYLQELNIFLEKHKNKWIFGHVSFDVKEELFNIPSLHKSNIQFPPLFFFVPEIVIKLTKENITIFSATDNPQTIYAAILSQKNHPTANDISNIDIQPKISKATYLQHIAALQHHIQIGDCYEINYCQEFFANHVTINPVATFKKLIQVSPTPFACYYTLQQQHLLCASPERYIKKEGSTLISQPIKGTIKRNKENSATDNILKETLRASKKDQRENVMIVDLVRNDFSRICKPGSVKVEELFGIYTYPQVHQMISTITGEVENNINLAHILQETFPMGSMTGAPKKKVLALTEQYEQSKRGIYSGTVGYIDPTGNFDFNVVIRSILYNANHQYLSYLVGGGITFYSNAENEYEECLLKAEAMKKALA